MIAEDTGVWTPDYFLSNETECRRLMKDPKTRSLIPSLNASQLHSFKDKQLVRFRGMIQDTYNPEFYLDSYQSKNVKTGEVARRRGKFRDTLDSEDDTVILDSDNNVNAERQTCFVISIPCLNDWAREKMPPTDRVNDTNSSNSSAKRSLESEPMEIGSEVTNCGKKQTRKSPDKTTEAPSLLSKEHAMNFPVPNEDGKACIVKFYEDTSFKLNQVVEIVGFLSLDPVLSLASNDSEDVMEDVEFQSHNPPASLIPRLHAIEVNDALADEIPGVISNGEKARADLKLVLSQILFGDSLAAEYVICHLISSVYLRRDLLSLGNFPLNITNFSLKKAETFTEDFYQILSQIIPKSHLLGISLDELNNLNLLPKKDYDCNRLTSGVLQLSDNTHLVLDETKLTSGQVSAYGRKNYEALSGLIKSQKVTYDFKFYTMDFETDIPVMILSETKSMIPCERQIVLEKSTESENLYSEIMEATRQYLKDESRISNIRNYLSTSRRRDIKIDDKIGDVIQDDFVRMRQSDKNTTAEDLHSLMVLARLISLSHGEDSISVDHWKQAIGMENDRKSRIRSRSKSNLS